MQCQSPFQLKERHKLTGDIITVPCGKCPACVGRYSSAWSFRLMQEEKISTSAYFITLTYSEDNLPLSAALLMTLKKEHFQYFMKRLRHSTTEKVKYYAVGEYGSKLNRPHYHAIIFNAKKEAIEKAWGLGYVHYGDVTGASIGYTLKYMCKKSKPVGVSDGDDREPEFGLMSKGLGFNYLTSEMKQWHYSDINNRMYVNTQGKKITMPRYYKDKLFSEENFENKEHADKVREIAGLHARNRLMNMEVKMINKIGEWAYEHSRLEHDIHSFKELQNKAQKGDKL